MSNNKQSSVEWFSKESWKLKVKLENKEITLGEYGVTYVDLLKQAKAMHKEEIINATIYGNRFQGCYGLYSEQYYNETYGGNNEQQ
jgi:hypothetical protein